MIEYIALCKQTISYLSGKEVLSAKDKKYLKDLHKVIFKVEEEDLNKIYLDIKRIADNNVKVPKR